MQTPPPGDPSTPPPSPSGLLRLDGPARALPTRSASAGTVPRDNRGAPEDQAPSGPDAPWHEASARLRSFEPSHGSAFSSISLRDRASSQDGTSGTLEGMELSLPRHDPATPLPRPLELRGANQESRKGPPSVVDLDASQARGSDSTATILAADAGRAGSDTDFDIESLRYGPIDKRPLGITEFAAKTERAALIDAVRTHAIMHPMVQLGLRLESELGQELADLIDQIDQRLQDTRRVTADDGSVRMEDLESGLDIAELHEYRERLEHSAQDLKACLDDLARAQRDFLDYKARQETGASTASDRLQRHVFGKELQAIFARSALQSILTVGATAGFQYSTVKVLEGFFGNNPEHIPSMVLEQAREALGPDATEQDVVQSAIDSFVGPGSTYLDENQNGDTAIYTTEAAVGMIRGVIVPMADSINETDARSGQVSEAVAGVGSPPVPKTAKDRAAAAMSNAWPAQVKANLISGGVAATIATGATKQTTGPMVLLEIAKTLGFSGFSAVNNVLADGVRHAVYDGDSKGTSQAIKAGARIAGRGAAQMMKTGVSYLQSAASASLESRSLAGDAIKGTVQVGLSGTFKESLGALAQRLTEANLPPNEKAAIRAGAAILAVADFSRALNALVSPGDLPPDALRLRQSLANGVENTLAGVLEANDVTFESTDFDAALSNYRGDVVQRITPQSTQ